MKKTKIGIALEGGGAKGAYQMGVLKALLELNVAYDCVVGTSIGTLNGIAYVLRNFERYCPIWYNIKFSYNSKDKVVNQNESFDFERIKKNIEKFEKQFLSNKGIDAEPIIKMLKDNVDEKEVREAGIDFGLTTYCLTDRKPMELFIKEIPEGMLHEFLFASCHLPVFKPRPIQGKYYLDGSMVNRLPIDMLIDKGYETIITVRLHDYFDFSKYQGFKIIDIAPGEFLSNTLDASQERIDWMISKGYNDAIRILKENIEYLK